MVVERSQQHFSGGNEPYYEHRKPCDASRISRFRRAIGEDGVEYLLKVTAAIFSSDTGPVAVSWYFAADPIPWPETIFSHE